MKECEVWLLLSPSVNVRQADMDSYELAIPSCSIKVPKDLWEVVCPLLDGEHDEDEIIEGATSASFPMTVVYYLLYQLEQNGMLVVRSPMGASGAADASLSAEKPCFVSRSKRGYTDGGDRIMSPADSLKKYSSLVHPDGIVHNLRNQTPLNGHLLAYYLAVAEWKVVNPLPESSSLHKVDVAVDHRLGRALPTGLSCGKGRTREQARMSAVGEALERYSTQYFGNESVYQASYNEVKDCAVNPWSLISFSENQYLHAAEWSRQGPFSVVPRPYQEDIPIDWVKAWSFTEKRLLWIPAAFAYYHYPRERGGEFFIGNSNGVAGGNCQEEAFLHGLYELIERDAVAVWWYNRLRLPRIDVDAFADGKMRRLLFQLKNEGFGIDAIDLTNDLGIPVAIVIARKGGDRIPCLGMGCHLDMSVALDRAVSELVQGIVGAEQMAMFEDTVWKPLESRYDTCFLHSDESLGTRIPQDYANCSSPDLKDDIAHLLAVLQQHKMDCYFHNLTREEAGGYSVCRVIVPDLAFFWPRFSCRRLYQVPVIMGWTDQPLKESELTQISFPL